MSNDQKCFYCNRLPDGEFDPQLSGQKCDRCQEQIDFARERTEQLAKRQREAANEEARLFAEHFAQELSAIDLDRLLQDYEVCQVYAGRPGCMCGCRGTYRETSAAIKRALSDLRAQDPARVELDDETLCISWENEAGTRVRVLYLRPRAEDPAPNASDWTKQGG